MALSCDLLLKLTRITLLYPKISLFSGSENAKMKIREKVRGRETSSLVGGKKEEKV
jgi:hypothetical protein